MGGFDNDSFNLTQKLELAIKKKFAKGHKITAEEKKALMERAKLKLETSIRIREFKNLYTQTREGAAEATLEDKKKACP